MKLYWPFWDDAEQLHCRKKDAQLFFRQYYDNSRGGRYVKEAKAICAGCPVQQKCLEWALYYPEVDGIWGGTTPLERRRMRRTMKITVTKRQDERQRR